MVVKQIPTLVFVILSAISITAVLPRGMDVITVMIHACACIQERGDATVEVMFCYNGRALT